MWPWFIIIFYNLFQTSTYFKVHGVTHQQTVEVGDSTVRVGISINKQFISKFEVMCLFQ